MAKIIQTVLGPIEPKSLGRTLTHEHLTLNYTKFLKSPPSAFEKFLQGELTLKNIGFVQRYPYSNLSNVSFFSQELQESVLYDVKLFKEFGGGAIVENTNHGLGRDIPFLKKVSEISQVHVVAGTGFYLASVQPKDVLGKKVEELCEVMIQDLTLGCPECPSVKCGFVGEVASDYPLHDFEEKAIEATGGLQDEMKCPVSFHPGRDRRAPSEIMRIYAEAGGNPEKAVMSHLDRTFSRIEDMLEFASEFKCYLQHDLFGTEVLSYQFDPSTQMPSDSQRIERIQALIEEGHSHRILISHDIHTRHRLVNYGGHGYLHLYGNVLPKMINSGISQQIIDEITVENPKNWLQWSPAENQF